MSPIFLPRVTPLPPFDATGASSTSLPGCFDAVADAEEALEAQVKRKREREGERKGNAIRFDGRSFLFLFALPSGAPQGTVLFDLLLPRWEDARPFSSPMRKKDEE